MLVELPKSLSFRKPLGGMKELSREMDFSQCEMEKNGGYREVLRTKGRGLG